MSNGNYYQLCREQLLNLNNLYIITYNNNLQMHTNFNRLLLQESTNERNNDRNRISMNATRQNFSDYWYNRHFIASPPPPPSPPSPPPLFRRPHRTQPRTRSSYNFGDQTHNLENVRRRRANRINSNFTPPRRTTTSFPISFSFSPTQDVINNSLYDRYPNNPLSTTDFIRETTYDTWINIRTLMDLPITSRCAITQRQFNDNEIVSRIYHCGHLFNRDALLRWFERDNRCPICRYNLAATTPATASPPRPATPVAGSPPILGSPIERAAARAASRTQPTDLSNNSQERVRNPVTWRDPIVSTFINGSNGIESLVSDIEQNITNTIMDNSQNFMDLSEQVANSLFGAVSNNLNNTANITDFFTTEFSFNLPTNSTDQNFNTRRCTQEQKEEEKAEEKDDEDDVD